MFKLYLCPAYIQQALRNIVELNLIKAPSIDFDWNGFCPDKLVIPLRYFYLPNLTNLRVYNPYAELDLVTSAKSIKLDFKSITHD